MTELEKLAEKYRNEHLARNIYDYNGIVYKSVFVTNTLRQVEITPMGTDPIQSFINFNTSN